MFTNPTAIVIVGPTASGKSALALAIAKEFNGAVVNADSMQVYKGLPILTAQPSARDYQSAEHHLYGVLSPNDPCSAVRWRNMATDRLNTLWENQRLPIITGGTGLYIRALCQGLSPMPAVPEDIRNHTRMELQKMGNEAFHARLATIDPQMAEKLDIGNSQRLSRAWEVWQSSGKTFSHWQSLPAEGAVSANWITLVLDPPRTQLRESCEKRFHTMIEQGAIEEVKRLFSHELDPSLPITKALGVPELLAYLQQDLPLDQAISQSVKATIAYAKRQQTWFRHQIPTINMKVKQFSESLMIEIFSMIRHSC